MSKISKYTDIVVLAFIGYLITVAIFQHFTQNVTVTLNFYFGVSTWIFTVCYKIFKKGAGKYAVFVLLLFAVFNIIIFTASVSSFGQVYYLYEGNNILIASIGLNPFLLLIFIIYFSVNNSIGKELYHRVFYGSEKEQQQILDKEIEFYYNKFSVYSEEQLNEIYKHYKDYPYGAQVALEKIHTERKLNLMDF